MEHLSDASFLGTLLVLPANIRLDWKVIARYKISSLFGLVISNKGKKVNNIDTRSSRLTASSNRLEMMTLTLSSASCKVRIAFSRLETPVKTSIKLLVAVVEVSSDAVNFRRPKKGLKYTFCDNEIVSQSNNEMSELRNNERMAQLSNERLHFDVL